MRGARRATTSRFHDDVWHLTPAVLQQHKQAVILNFTTLPDLFRFVAKELCCAMLVRDLPPSERESRVETIRGYFVGLSLFLRWADQRGVPSLAAVTPGDLDAYNDHLLASRRSVRTAPNGGTPPS